MALYPRAGAQTLPAPAALTSQQNKHQLDAIAQTNLNRMVPFAIKGWIGYCYCIVLNAYLSCHELPLNFQFPSNTLTRNTLLLLLIFGDNKINAGIPVRPIRDIPSKTDFTL